jgi:alpha-tubulin suppressor-like RCC1 family protein
MCPLVAGEHGERLQYNGGPVQHEPQLYLLFWGSAWEGHQKLASELDGLFYGNLKAENEIPGGTAAWQGILSQYYSNTKGPYHNARLIAEAHVNNIRAPQNIEDATVQHETSEFIRELYAKSTPPNANAQFIVLPTPGSTYKDETLVKGNKIFACGYHFVTSEAFGANEEHYSYSLIPYSGDVVGVNSKGEKENCNYAAGYGGSEEEQLGHSTTFVASHEFAESVTEPLTSRKYNSPSEDPYQSRENPNVQEVYGWTGEPKNDNTEIGDECLKYGPFQLPKRAWVTKLWDDEGGNKCSLEDPPYPPPPAPSAITGVATGVTTTGATVTGSVNPNGPDAHYYFEYGPTTSYGTKIPTPPGNDAGFGTKAVPASAKITDLQPSTVYHYRLVASSWVGTTDGADHTFTTTATGTLSAGTKDTCALMSSGGVDCWGENYFGEVYPESSEKKITTPVAVKGVTKAIEVAAGGSHVCALLSGGSIECWGDNQRGELGIGYTSRSSTPVRVIGITNAIAITAGDADTCALLSGGTIDCWGENVYGELGNGTTTNSSTPVPVKGITNAIAVTAGYASTCAVLSGGGMDCWGYNGYGELGNGTTKNSSTPVPVKGITNASATAVPAVGEVHACALLSGGSLDCWGYNEQGELGNGTTTSSSTPVAVSGITNAATVAAGYFHTCASLSPGGDDCWGENYFGELGNGTTTNSSTPVAASGITTATGVAAGEAHSCARLIGGGVDCWGDNIDGQLGNGTTNNSTTPVAVSGIS